MGRKDSPERLTGRYCRMVIRTSPRAPPPGGVPLRPPAPPPAGAEPDCPATLPPLPPLTEMPLGYGNAALPGPAPRPPPPPLMEPPPILPEPAPSAPPPPPPPPP